MVDDLAKACDTEKIIVLFSENPIQTLCQMYIKIVFVYYIYLFTISTMFTVFIIFTIFNLYIVNLNLNL